ncbi:hypothetical protein BDP27DRAFT_1323480 [Rhodocollybia butyracea]|uniref:Uncharacterized protein n=1 Tax=Rhodocollybia butyracea TaxID=206335 RepID=A0A9P5PWI8_9AGAR|nr:hypothetical protein BDP27DRAFT_1323480 [Rhodocollybia butyracea]
MMITPRIGLVFFAALISAVHAMPIDSPNLNIAHPPPPPANQPESPIHPAVTVHPDRKDWGKPYRVTVFGDKEAVKQLLSGISNEDWTAQFPSMQEVEKSMITRTIKTVRVDRLPGVWGPGKYTRPFRYTNPTHSDSSIKLKSTDKTVVFALEGKYNSHFCGEWPCLGRRGKESSWIYQIDPDVPEQERFKKDWPEKAWTADDKAFWSCPEIKELVKNWPKLWGAIEKQDKEKAGGLGQTRKNFYQARRKKEAKGRWKGVSGIPAILAPDTTNQRAGSKRKRL